MPDFKTMIKGMKEKENPKPQEPKKSQRDLDTEEHNKRIAQINAKAPGMKHEDYKAEIAKEDARFNSVQDKWKDELAQNQPETQEQDYPYDENVLEGITRDTPEKAKKLAQAIYAYRVAKDMDLAGKLFDEYLGK